MGDPYYVLSFKGGGVRGAYSFAVAEKLGNEVPGFNDRANRACGVSTGGIGAAGWAAGLSWSDIVGLYENKADEIFADSWLDDLMDAGKTLGADYGSKGLRKALTEQFGDKTLGDLAGQVSLVTFALDRQTRGVRRWAPRILRNMPGDPHRALSVVEACMQTSAAPLYFPAVRDRRPDYDTFVIDGGVVMNNPALVALGEAVKYLVAARGCTQAEALADVHILSVGTGVVPKFVDTAEYADKDSLDWGAKQWLKYIFDVLLDGPAYEISHIAELLLGDRYYEIETVYDQEIGLDAADKVPQLVALGRAQDISGAVDWLKKAGWAAA